MARKIKNNIEIKILDILKKSKSPLSTLQIANDLECAWHTALTRLLEMRFENKVREMRIGKMRAWMLRR